MLPPSLTLRLKLVAAALPCLRSWRARAAGWRWPLTGPLPENYYARLELLGPKRFSEGRLGRSPPLLLDDYDEPPLFGRETIIMRYHKP